MGLKNLYAVRDAKTEAFFPPFLGVTHGEAIRSFQDISKNPESLLAKFPEDYALFYIGTFDDQTGALTSSQPTQLSSALEFSSKKVA